MADYVLRVRDPLGGSLAMVDLDCDDDFDAIRIACQAATPYGHDLWKDRRLVGWFERRGSAAPFAQEDQGWLA